MDLQLDLLCLYGVHTLGPRAVIRFLVEISIVWISEDNLLPPLDLLSLTDKDVADEMDLKD